MNADPESQSLLAQILLLIVLTLINAFLAASEIAVVSVNKNRVEQKRKKEMSNHKKLLKIIDNPTNFLSTIQVGITLVNILSGASLADTLSTRLAPLLGGGTAAKSLANIIVLAILTYVSIVFGELYPKRIAMNKSEEVAQFTSGVIPNDRDYCKALRLVLICFNKLIGANHPMEFDDEDTKMTRDEMRYMLETEGVFEEDELEMLQGIFH